MFKKQVPFLLALTLFSRLAWSDGTTPAKSTLAAPVLSLPAAIHATLDAEYPGWKLAPVSSQIQNEFKKHRLMRPPSLAVGDFNHDGKRDYAVQIALTSPGQEEQVIMVFLAGANGYEETIVQSMGLDPTAYLWVGRKALPETGPNAQETLTTKDVLMVLGGPVGDTVYAYDDGKFQEIKSEEDPEHPDSAIPRPLEPQ